MSEPQIPTALTLTRAWSALRVGISTQSIRKSPTLWSTNALIFSAIELHPHPGNRNEMLPLAQRRMVCSGTHVRGQDGRTEWTPGKREQPPLSRDEPGAPCKYK